MILTKGHLGKFKVTGRKSAEFVPALYHSYEEILEVPTTYKDCLLPEGVS